MKHVVVATLGDAIAAVDAERVSHIVWDTRVTPLPGSPSYIEGVLAYRRNLVGVVDLARKLKRKSDGSRKHIVLVQEDDMMVGLRVDRVLGVFSCDAPVHGDPGVIKVQNRDALLVQPGDVLSGKAKRVLHELY